MDRSPSRFFLLVFVLSLPFWALGAATEHRSTGLPVNIPISAQMACCPLLAALILRHRESGSAGVRQVFRDAFDHRRISPRRWYVPTFLLMPAVMLLSYAAMRLTGRPLPDPQLPWLAIPVFFLVFFAAAVGEEAGWMGYVFGPMQDRWSALTAGLLLGCVWAAWHIVPLVQAHHPADWIAWQCLGTVARRVLIVWIFNNTSGSVLAAVLLHAVDNVSVFAFPNYGSNYDPMVTGIVVVVAALVVTFLWGPRTLASHRFGGVALHRPAAS